MTEQPEVSRDLSPRNLGFLTARAWLDEDGRHIWLHHDCVDGPTETMLPTTWLSDKAGDVHPSIHCTACGLHYMAHLEGS